MTQTRNAHQVVAGEGSAIGAGSAAPTRSTSTLLLTITLALTSAIPAAAGWPVGNGPTGHAPIGAAGGAPIGATGRAPTGSIGSVTRFTGNSGTHVGYNNSNRSGSRNFDHGHSYGRPERHHYGLVAPFFYGLPYDPAMYYGDDSGAYSDGPGPYAADPQAQHYAVQENMLGEELRDLNARIEALQQNAPPPPAEAEANPPAPPTPPVTVVLRNGKTFQSNSYAVMNNTFWDFSKTPARRVAMADVDVPASVQATAQNGAEFPE